MAALAPVDGGNVAISASTTTARGTLNTKGDKVLVTNSGTTLAFVKLGGSGVDATAADIPVLPTTQILIARGTTDTHLAALLASGTGTVYAHTGHGE